MTDPDTERIMAEDLDVGDVLTTDDDLTHTVVRIEDAGDVQIVHVECSDHSTYTAQFNSDEFVRVLA